MNVKLLLIISCAANLALGAYALHHWKSHRAGPGPSAAPASIPTADKPQPASPAPVAGERVIVKVFNWEAVESADYKEYIANLRAVGCPEETIRDIILADVNKLYDQKKRDVRGQGRRFEYWKAGTPFMMAADPETSERLRALDQERLGVLRELGIEPDARLDMAQIFNPFDSMLDFLPEEKKSSVLKLFTQMQEKLAATMSDGAPDGAEIAKVQKEMEQMVKQLLTPEEALDFDLRFSMTANMMRMQLSGFDPDENEFLSVFQLRKAFDDEFSVLERGDDSPGAREQRQAAENALNEQIKLAIGTDRFEDYQRSQDHQFQQMHRSARRAGLGTAEAVQVHDIKKIAETQAAEARRSLQGGARDQALQGIRHETEQAIQKVLGSEGWEHYNRANNTFWLQNIHTTSPQPRPPVEIAP